MQRTQNRWSVISLSITSTSLQQPSRLPLSSPKPQGVPAPSDPRATSSHRRKPHTPVDKDTGKQSHLVAQQSAAQGLKSPLAATGISEPRVGGGLHVTNPSSGNGWRSLQAEKESNRAPGTHCNPKPRWGSGSPEAHWVGQQLAGPAHAGTQGWTAPVLTECLNAFSGQHACSKQRYVKTK